MAADDSGRGARRIDQNAIEGMRAPEALGVTGICDRDLCRAPKPFEILADEPDALGIDIDRRHLPAVTQPLEDVSGLATRSGTGIEDPHSDLEIEQDCRELSPCVLDRGDALREARELIDADWAIQ